MSSMPRSLERDTPLIPPIIDGDNDADSINPLLRGELSAVESYDQVLAKFPDEPGVAELRNIRREHFRAATFWQERLRAHGAEPAESSGVWGVFAAAVTGSAKVFGWNTALAALKQGEEAGVRQYENAADDDTIASECQSKIQGDLLPTCQRHIAKLIALQKSTD